MRIAGHSVHTCTPICSIRAIRVLFLSGCASGAALLEAFATEHRTPLCWLKRDGRFFAAMRAARARLHFLISVRRSRADSSNAFSFAGLAALGLVLELFVVEEKLFAGGEEKLRAAIDALEQPVLEFHVRSPRPSRENPWLLRWRAGRHSQDLFPTSGSALRSHFGNGLQLNFLWRLPVWIRQGPLF